jgi:hypothetical protein
MPCGTRYGERGGWNKKKRQIHFLLCATTHITVPAFLLGFQSWDPYWAYGNGCKDGRFMELSQDRVQ